MSTLIKNGRIVTPAETFQADLLIEKEKIVSIGDLSSVSADEVIDAAGLYVLPGGVDAHVHLDLPMAGTVSSDDHYTGTKAAAFGGTTTVIDFISQDSDDLVSLVEAMRAKADAKAAIDYSFHMNITHYNEQVDRAIPELVKRGITSLKVFTAYNHRLRLQDGEILQVLRTAKKNGLLTMMHAENGDVIDLLIQEAIRAGHLAPIWHARTRPAWGAEESVARGAALAATADAPLYIVHMNAGGEVDQLEYARSLGIAVMGETCPQYLFFTEKELERPDGAKWICSPPVRTESDQQRLWEGLEDGVIQTIATDHCPFFFDGTKPILYEGKPVQIPGKELGKDDFTKIPNGLPGIGDRMPVMWDAMVSSGRFTVNQFVELTCANPAKIFGMYPRKGCLLPGADADVVLWDPEKRVKYGTAFSQQRTDYNLYEGWELKGFPVRVISRGKTLVENGTWYGNPGEGKFVACEPFHELI
ncbi:MAG: dihydropyrimidinase [Anaerolineaceae bacterium]|nr:dihydropyrimidinase [Anaerolineaceae bacterium]